MTDTKRIFVGFSTINETIGNFKKYDIDLIKTDLLNHFYTKKGERVMQPEFGTIIWDLLFDPFTEEIAGQIRGDIERILDSEPRVSAESISLIEEDYGFTVVIDLLYRPFDVVDVLEVIFDRNLLEREANG